MNVPADLFVGPQVRLTPIAPADLEAFAEWTNDSGYLRNIRVSGAVPESVESVTAFARAEHDDPRRYGFTIRTNTSDDAIGIAVVKDIDWTNRSAWVAIGIGPSHLRGRRLGSEAIGLLVDFAFDELCLHRISLSVIEYNHVAIKAYRRQGFVEEGVLRAAVERDGERYDLLIFGLLAEERSAGS